MWLESLGVLPSQRRCQRTEAQREDLSGLAHELGCGTSPGAPSKKAAEAASMGGLCYKDRVSSALRAPAASGFSFSIIP